MKCPNRKCGRDTSRILFTVRNNLKTGKAKEIRGCPACFEHLKQNALYTGQKIWLGTEAYGEDGVRERNHAYGERLKASAQRNRRDVSYVSPEAFEVMTGKRPARGQFQ